MTLPLEHVDIDILEPIRKARSGHQFILVITDRFAKFTQAAPMKKVGALNVSKVFLDHRFFAYGAPSQVLADNGPQFSSKLFQFLCSALCVRNLFTTTYRPQSMDRQSASTTRSSTAFGCSLENTRRSGLSLKALSCTRTISK